MEMVGNHHFHLFINGWPQGVPGGSNDVPFHFGVILRFHVSFFVGNIHFS